MKKKIAFLINPYSGTSTSRKQANELIAYLKSNPQYSLFVAQQATEMREITLDLVQQNYNAIIGCGGDGTLNLVSESVLGTDTALGIIPLGSGNGFARHHHIPLQWNKAIKIIENPIVSLHDTGLINGIHFINVAGIGFAAKIAHAFKGKTKRGLSGYAKTVLRNLNMDPFQVKISNENSSWVGESWMVDFCNGSQWGNNFKLEPGARDDDGTLNAVIFKKMSLAKIPALGFRFATNTVPSSNDTMMITGSEFTVEFEGIRPLHVDGEATALIENFAKISVVPKNLRLWTA